MTTRITILGAGFGGLELSTLLSEALGDKIAVTLIDKADSFIFGFSKLDVMFGHVGIEDVRMPYRNFVKPGVRLLRETVTAIDPAARCVTTDKGTHDSDFLVIALGADYDIAATPGLSEHGNEFYSVAGAQELGELLPGFAGGRVIIGISAAPYKCPPAPSECALMLHDYLTERGVRGKSEITVVMPMGTPVPPSPETSQALLGIFAQRGITFMGGKRVASLNAGTAVIEDGTELPFDLYMGVPKHRAPKVVEDSGLVENGWVTINPRTLETSAQGVYAIGDLAATGAPKAGVFAEGAAKAVAISLISRIKGGSDTGLYAGAGTCYLEFGEGQIGKVEVDFFSGPTPTGTYHQPSTDLRAEKNLFGSSRRARWFGM